MVGPVMWSLLRHASSSEMNDDSNAATAGVPPHGGAAAPTGDVPAGESNAMSDDEPGGRTVGNPGPERILPPFLEIAPDAFDFDMDDDFALPPAAIDVNGGAGMNWDGASSGGDDFDLGYASTTNEFGSRFDSDSATWTIATPDHTSVASVMCPTDELGSILATPGERSPMCWGAGATPAFGFYSPPRTHRAQSSTEPYAVPTDATMAELQRYAAVEENNLRRDHEVLKLLMHHWRRRAGACKRVPRQSAAVALPLRPGGSLSSSAECAHRVGGRRVALRSSRRSTLGSRGAATTSRRSQQAACSGRRQTRVREARGGPSFHTMAPPPCCPLRAVGGNSRPIRGVLL